MSKCKGCKWQSHGKMARGNTVILYCIGSPDHEPEYGTGAFIDQERVIKTGFEDNTVYRADDNDECHFWACERFELNKGKA